MTGRAFCASCAKYKLKQGGSYQSKKGTTKASYWRCEQCTANVKKFTKMVNGKRVKRLEE